MSTEKERTFVQCTKCGHILIVERRISMERSIIKSHCENCGYDKALNCGYSEDDVAELCDPYLDCRYFY